MTSWNEILGSLKIDPWEVGLKDAKFDLVNDGTSFIIYSVKSVLYTTWLPGLGKVIIFLSRIDRDTVTSYIW